MGGGGQADDTPRASLLTRLMHAKPSSGSLRRSLSLKKVTAAAKLPRSASFEHRASDSDEKAPPSDDSGDSPRRTKSLIRSGSKKVLGIITRRGSSHKGKEPESPISVVAAPEQLEGRNLTLPASCVHHLTGVTLKVPDADIEVAVPPVQLQANAVEEAAEEACSAHAALPLSALSLPPAPSQPPDAEAEESAPFVLALNSSPPPLSSPPGLPRLEDVPSSAPDGTVARCRITNQQPDRSPSSTPPRFRADGEVPPTPPISELIGLFGGSEISAPLAQPLVPTPPAANAAPPSSPRRRKPSRKEVLRSGVPRALTLNLEATGSQTVSLKIRLHGISTAAASLPAGSSQARALTFEFEPRGETEEAARAPGEMAEVAQACDALVGVEAVTAAWASKAAATAMASSAADEEVRDAEDAEAAAAAEAAAVRVVAAVVVEALAEKAAAQRASRPSLATSAGAANPHLAAFSGTTSATNPHLQFCLTEQRGAAEPNAEEPHAEKPAAEEPNAEEPNVAEKAAAEAWAGATAAKAGTGAKAEAALPKAASKAAAPKAAAHKAAPPKASPPKAAAPAAAKTAAKNLPGGARQAPKKKSSKKKKK